MKIFVPLFVLVSLLSMADDASAQLFRGRFRNACAPRLRCQPAFPGQQILPCRAPLRYTNCARCCERFLECGDIWSYHKCVTGCYQQNCRWVRGCQQFPGCCPRILTKYRFCLPTEYNACVNNCPTFPPQVHQKCVHDCAVRYCDDLLD